jgi:hypothetical protein
VSLILHLSDLHLGNPSKGQRDYDDKVGIGEAAGHTDIDHLKRTVSALGTALRGLGKELDAVVITGDLTSRNHADGYRDFTGLLGELEGSKPPDDRILVVPGNHDVDWDLRPGDPRKLNRFLDTVRPAYRSPLINGVDYDDRSPSLASKGHGVAEPILELNDAAIVAISSADFCGTETETHTDWDRLVDTGLKDRIFRRKDAKRQQAKEELRCLRIHDIARVHYRQLDALSKRIDSTSIAGEADESEKLRIAALHHPIGVAANREEIKPFEMITNLAEVRSFLFDRGFHLILHGHKHESYAGWEWLLPPGDNLEAIPRRALVLGSPGRFRVGAPICRLIEVAPDESRPVAGAPRLRIVDVEGVRGSQELRLDFRATCHSLAQPFMQSTDVDTPWVVKARTADAAYQQLIDLPANDQVRRPVISVIEDPGSTSRLPANYKEGDDALELSDLVRWWQLARPEAVRWFSGSAFNHGERLYAGADDAIARAVRALPSSKAIALLVDPKEAGNPDLEFPAFTAVQLQPRLKDEGEYALDIVGIYRKQDLNLWWPVNMAELAYIQARAVAMVIDEERLRGEVEAGRLIAMTTFGVHDDILPQMAGTALDRAVDLRPEWLYQLASLAAHPNQTSEAEWEKALGDIGLREGAGLLVPAIGIDRLLAALKVAATSAERSADFERLIEAVRDLASLAHDAEAALTGRSSNGRATLDSWGDRLRGAADEVRAALKAALEGHSA